MTQDSIENLFQSIDTIVDARIANLPFDQTVQCEIINADDAINGNYIVQYQASTFTAISENKDLKPKDIVYVQIPQGDFTQDKFIINKKTISETTKSKKKPFLNFVKDTNLIRDNASRLEYNVTTSSDGLESRSSMQPIQNFYNNSALLAGYTRMGVKLSIKSNIPYTMKSGNYGVRIQLTGFDQTKTYLPGDTAHRVDSPAREVRTYELSINDMIGSNFYNTLGYNNQEKVFDITNFVIASIQIYFFQDGKFITENNSSAKDNRIYFTNISLYFGYDIKDFYNTDYKAYLYTTDGFQYNSEYYIKNLYLRLVRIENNKTDLNVLTNDTTLPAQFKLYWEEYDPNSAEISTWAKIMSYTNMNYAYPYKSQVLSVARNRRKHGYVITVQDTANGTSYVTNVLEFNNTSYIEGSELLDILTGFQAEFTSDDNGRFFIYGQDSTSTNKIISTNIHYILLSYIPSSDTNTDMGIQMGDVITWTIPGKNTMIEPVFIDVDGFTNNDDGDYIISKTVLKDTDLDPTEHKFRVPYKIKDYYSNQFTNNTIHFTLKRNDGTFTTEKELLFGTSGSQGNEYNIAIRLYKVINNNKVYVNAIPMTDSTDTYYYPEITIYDYDNRVINNDPTLNYPRFDWRLNQPINFEGAISLQRRLGGSENTYGIVRPESSNILLYKPAFITYTIHISATDTQPLTAVFPIAISKSSDYTAISGSTIITYDITGKKPVYTKAPFEVQGGSSNISWEIYNYLTLEQPWAPILNNNCLVAPSIFHVGSETCQYSLLLRDNGTPAWVQPIYMHQNKYPIGYDQPELNQLKFGDYTVDTTLVGKLKNTNNKVSGIVMGVLNHNLTDTLGLYAFHEDTEFFCIDENGYVYLNGGTDDNSENGGVNITNAYITNSTLSGVTLTGVNNGTIQYAKNYSNDGNIKANFDRIKTAITALGGSYTIV